MKPKINWNDREERKAYMKKYNQKPEIKEKKRKYQGTHKEERKKYLEKNKEKVKASSKKWYEEHKEETKAQEKKYRQEHKEERKAYDEKYNEEHKEERKAYKEKYYKNNKDKIKKYYNRPEVKEKRKINEHNRQVRKKGNGGSYTIEEITKLRKETNGICKGYNREPHYVGDKNLTIDHIIPIKKGGTNYIENIQLLCGSCNSHKHTTIKK